MKGDSNLDHEDMLEAAGACDFEEQERRDYSRKLEEQYRRERALRPHVGGGKSMEGWFKGI